MKLGVNPRGPNALITHDNLRSDILAQFYIRVQADREHILNAARSLGENSVNAESVESLVSEKLVSALRAIASQMDLFEIHTKRDEFAERVKEHVKSDLEANGLLLESVTISELDQTDPSELSDNNVFDAQGKRKITEITTAALVERNNLERAAEQARKIRDVATRQQILELERQQAESEANQRTEIAKIQAEKGRESQEAVIAQERSVEIARIEKDQALEVAELGRVQAVEVARVGACVERDTKAVCLGPGGVNRPGPHVADGAPDGLPVQFGLEHESLDALGVLGTGGGCTHTQAGCLGVAHKGLQLASRAGQSLD